MQYHSVSSHMYQLAPDSNLALRPHKDHSYHFHLAPISPWIAAFLEILTTKEVF